MMVQIFVLLVVYQLKHFLADFPLQGKYMLGKFKPGAEYLGPLAAHCGVHAFMTFWIAGAYMNMMNDEPPSWEKLNFVLCLAVVDFVVHFIMDRIKAAPHYLGRFKNLTASEYASHTQGGAQGNAISRALVKGNTYFWWALGFDQAIHHLTHYYIIFRLVTA